MRGFIHFFSHFSFSFLLLFPFSYFWWGRRANYFFRPFYVQYRLRYCTHPLTFPRSGDAASALHFRLRECTTFGAFPQAGTGTEIITNLRLRGCKILVALPQAELSALDSIPARGKCKFSCASLLVGTVHRNNYKTSACGDAIFWLHFRKRNCRRWIVFPRGENLNFHVHLRSRGRCTEIITKSPLAGM